jgi:ankyrin repeat protein
MLVAPPTSRLRRAINAKDLPAIRASIKAGADLHGSCVKDKDKDKEQRTPLEEAVLSGFEGSVLILLDAGAKIRDEGKTLHYAIDSGDIAVFRKVLDIITAKNYLGVKDAHAPLSMAALHGNLDMCKLLLERGADPNLCGIDGRYPIHYVFLNSAKHPVSAVFNLIELLLKNGVPPINTNSVYPHLVSAIHLCVGDRRFIDEGLDIKLFELLIRRGADVNAESSLGSPLHVIAMTWPSCFGPEVIPFLVKSGADINARDDAGQTPLHCAAAAGGLPGNIAEMRQLLALGADVNAIDIEGRTALHWASDVHVVKFLMEAGVNPEVTDKFGETAEETHGSPDAYRPKIHAFLRAARHQAELDIGIAPPPTKISSFRL